MKGIQYFLLITLCYLPCSVSLHAQTAENALAGMTWEELIGKWEELAVANKNAEALPYARAALDKARRDSTEASLEYGNSLDCLGYSLHHTSQFSEAEQCFQRAVDHASLYLGENHEDYITRLSNLAMLHLDMGELAKSVSELEKVVHLSEKNLGADNPYFAIMVNNLGLAYETMGNLDHALAEYLRALELTEQTLGKDNARYAIRLSNIAAVLRQTGKFDQAIAYSQRALPIFEKTVGKKHPYYLTGLNGLMSAYMEVSRLDEAYRLSEEILSSLQENKAAEALEYYDFSACIAKLYFQMGQYQRCVDFGREALAKYQTMFPKAYIKHAYVVQLIMSALEKTGQQQEATAFALLYNHLTLDELRGNFCKFSEDEQLRLYQRSRKVSDNIALDFAIRHPEYPALAAASYEFEMTVKGLSLANRRQLFQSLHKNADAALTAQFEEWQRLQNEISKQYAFAPARRQTNLDSLLATANELERHLVANSEPFRLSNQPTHWQDAQAALSQGEAAIEFGRLKRNLSDSVLYAAWLIRPGDLAPQQVFLFEEKEVGSLAATLRLYAPEHSGAGKNLRELLWQPLEPLLKGITTLYFAPAGILHQINWGAVPVSATETLADRCRLHRLVSTRQILAIKRKPDPGLPASTLIFGGIQYDADSTTLSASKSALPDGKNYGWDERNRGALGAKWVYLPGSLAEAIDARQHMEKAGAKTTFVQGPFASESYFKWAVQQSPAPAVLHLATHGFFLTAPDTNAATGYAAAENPMARAGLVLSGANRAWTGEILPANQEDGILTALEISRLDLSGTTLAVLSACGTGQGKVDADEGVLGLQRAFKMAGVQYVIMTLWNVQDHDAQQFMGLFYDNWLRDKKPVPDAFRAAQRQMHVLHSKPFQPMAWAGFLLLE